MSATATQVELRVADDAARNWWLKLVTAACWLLFSVIVFRFDWTTVSAISILFGIVMLGAAATEGIGVFTSTGWWRLAYALLALAFVVIGIVSFVHPGGTFAALAGVMSFYFVIRGGWNIATSIGLGALQFRWITFLLGVAELLLGFWAAGYFGNRAVLLVVWVGALALTRAVADVIEAFAIRGLRSS
ncbi:MAG: HdeD family acid-resistance protein [Gaiellaceae bacterium]